VVLKVTNVHQVKVNEHDESEWNKIHAVFQVYCIGSVLLLLISNLYIVHLINFFNVQKLPYFSNVQGDGMWSKDLCIERMSA